MYPKYLDQFKNRQQELHRQAEHHRLQRSLTKVSQWKFQLWEAFGKALIRSGQYLLKPAQAAR